MSLGTPTRSRRALAVPALALGLAVCPAPAGAQGPPVGEASALCRTQGATSVPAQHALGVFDLWFDISRPPGKVNVCVRVEAGPQVLGGRLEIDSAGSPGVSPVIPSTSETDVSTTHCPQQIHESGSIDRIYTSNPGTNPLKVCITLLGTSRRIDIGTTTGPTSPYVRWVPDTGSPVPAQQLP